MDTIKYKYVHINTTPAKEQISKFGHVVLTGTLSNVQEDGFFSNEIITLKMFHIRLNQN